MRWERNIYFMSFRSNNDSLLHGVGIFRVQPGVLEVGLVENTRELSKLQEIRKGCYHIRMPEYVGITNFRVFFDELAAVVFQTSVDLPVSYPVGSLEKILDVCGMGLEGGLEGLPLSVLNGIEPELNGQFLDYAFLHENLSGGVVRCHPVNL